MPFFCPFSLCLPSLAQHLNAFMVVQVPKEWKLDPNWDAEPKQQLSHHRKFPSKWKATSPQQDPVGTVRVVDHFVIQQTQKSDL